MKGWPTFNRTHQTHSYFRVRLTHLKSPAPKIKLKVDYSKCYSNRSYSIVILLSYLSLTSSKLPPSILSKESSKEAYIFKVVNNFVCKIKSIITQFFNEE